MIPATPYICPDCHGKRGGLAYGYTGLAPFNCDTCKDAGVVWRPSSRPAAVQEAIRALDIGIHYFACSGHNDSRKTLQEALQALENEFPESPR